MSEKPKVEIDYAERDAENARQFARMQNTWTCDRGGLHSIHHLCDCPGMGLDMKALEQHGVIQVTPIPGWDEHRRAIQNVIARRRA